MTLYHHKAEPLKNIYELAKEAGMSDEEFTRQIDSLFSYRVCKIMEEDDLTEMITLLPAGNGGKDQITLFICEGDQREMFCRKEDIEKCDREEDFRVLN